MGDIWTHGTWTVTPGNEAAFVAQWRSLAEWTATEFVKDASAVLLRDTTRPNVFYSFGPWPDEQTIERWRDSDGFQEHLSRIRDLVDAFEPASAVEEARIGTALT